MEWSSQPGQLQAVSRGMLEIVKVMYKDILQPLGLLGIQSVKLGFQNCDT